MKKDSKMKNEHNFTPLKEIQITKFQDKQLEPSNLVIPSEFFDKSIFFQSNDDEKYIQDNFHFWSDDVENQISNNKNKEYFKEENYDYIQFTKNKNVMWKRSHNFFKFLKKEEEKKKKEKYLKDYTFLKNHNPLTYTKITKSKCDIEINYKFQNEIPEEEEKILKICETSIRLATDLEKEELQKKEDKKKTQKKKEGEIYQIYTPLINDLNFTNPENKIIKWIASVIQNIIEQDIKDVYVK